MHILKSCLVSEKDSLLSSSLWQPTTPTTASRVPHWHCYGAKGPKGRETSLPLAPIATHREGTLTALEKF